jgi:predicted DNA-binding transcriptional regulator YafY
MSATRSSLGQVRADRLLSLVLLLQARGGTTARALAAELKVSVRTVYRDLEALAAAGVPVVTSSGPGGGCRLMEGYRFPLRGLRPEEAEALLILGVPSVLREIGLDRALDAAHRQIRVTAGLASGPGPRASGSVSGASGPGPRASGSIPGARQPGPDGSDAALVHLDMPRWFGGQEEVPSLRDLAQALRFGRRLALWYRPRGGHDDEASQAESRVVGPLGLVNKAGTWYLVASVADGGDDLPVVRVFRAGRITLTRVLADPFERPAGFELAAFWSQWSAEFEASLPRLQVTLRAAPRALALFGEIFGQACGPALEAALPPDEHGWRVVTLSFEHERAAAHRLAGFGDQVEVLTPPSVRAMLVTAAEQILRRYHAAH